MPRHAASWLRVYGAGERAGNVPRGQGLGVFEAGRADYAGGVQAHALQEVGPRLGELDGDGAGGVVGRDSGGAITQDEGAEAGLAVRGANTLRDSATTPAVMGVPSEQVAPPRMVNVPWVGVMSHLLARSETILLFSSRRTSVENRRRLTA